MQHCCLQLPEGTKLESAELASALPGDHRACESLSDGRGSRRVLICLYIFVTIAVGSSVDTHLFSLAELSSQLLPIDVVIHPHLELDPFVLDAQRAAP